MKRSVLILLSSLLILLAACRSAPPAMKEAFEADITVSGSSLDCTAHLSRTPDSVTARMTSPPSVAGICYTFSDEELHTSRDGLDCITDADSLPAVALPRLLYTVLSRLSEAEYISSDESGDHYRLPTDSGDAQITCRDGVPVTLTVDGLPYTVAFA